MTINELATHWQDLANDYDQLMFEVPIMQQLIKKIVAKIPPSSQNIIDLGIGTGALTEAIVKKLPHANITGIDVSSAMLDQANTKFQAHKNISCIQTSAHDLTNFAENSFDVIVSNYALHHLTHQQKQQCCKRVMGLLKPGGLFIFGDQHCRFMGDPSDTKWLEHMLDLLYLKAKHYLSTASINRMLLQVELMPKFLKADGEIMASIAFWQQALQDASFDKVTVDYIEPRELLNAVISAHKATL